MSDVQARPAAARGRGSATRGGRGGLSSRGGRGTTRSATNGDSEHTSLPTLEDEGEIADLNKTHGSNLPVLKELFPNWSEVDLLYALKETDGDVTVTIERIAEGNISQWGEVSSQKKDRTKAKAKDTFTTTTGADGSAAARAARGGRGDGTRGRGRATERGSRGAIRGRSAVKPATDGLRAKENQPLSVPTDESNAWDTPKTNDDGGWAQAAATTPSWGAPAATDSAPAAPSKAAETPAPAAASQGVPKTWASMLRQSTVPKPAQQPPKEAPATQPEPVLEPLPAAAAAEPSPPAEAPAEAPEETAPPAPAPEEEHESIAELSAEPQEEQTAADTTTVVVPEVALLPSKDQLTETNLEQVADISNPPRTDTVASEAADSWDPHAAALSATATPLSASQAQHQPHKAPSSGFAATAIKATERTALPRQAPNHQRRFLDQQEAVRMPVAANQQLERTTLQFGAFNLNGSEDDIDGDREEPETRAQPPADSPVTQPRASLPPAPQAALPEVYSSQKAVPALPTGPSSTVTQASPAAAAIQQPASQATAPQPPSQPAAQQFGRFGQTSSQEQSPFPPKPFDTYSQGNQPSTAQTHLESYPGQQPPQAQPQTQQAGGAYSSAADQYSSYYTADPQSRPPYSFYGQGYGQQQQQQQQQTGQGQQEAGLGSRAGFGAYGASQADLASQYPQSTNPSRFGTTVAQDQSSGNTTPNPSTAQSQQPTTQTHPQSHVGQQQQQQQQQHGNQYFGQQQPYYGGYYSANYMNNQYGYGGFGPYGKGGVYGQPHHYGMSQQSPYDHNSTAASGYPQSTLHRADSGAASGLGDYGRAGSAQSAAQPGLGASGGFGGIHDAFGRGASSYGGQTGQAYNAPSTQPSGAASGNEDLKPFNDAKTAGGPSPSLASSGRPGSATNTAPSQSGLPPPQSAQPGMGGYGGYPSHLSHGLHSQSGSTGYGMAAGPAQGHQNSPYSGYGGFGGGNSYYGSQQSRHGGWGSNYSGGNGF